MITEIILVQVSVIKLTAVVVLFITVFPLEHTDYAALWECNWSHYLKSEVLNQIKSNNFGEIDSLLESNNNLPIAIANLQAFVQENFLGAAGSYTDFNEELIHSARELLVADGEELNSNVVKPEYLLIAKLMLEHLLKLCPDNFEYKWWYMRCISIYQKVLEESAASVYDTFCKISDELVIQCEDIGLEKIYKAQLLLEITQTYLDYRRILRAEELLEKTRSILGLDVFVEGRLGKRTKFQQKALPQMVIVINNSLEEEKLTFPSTKDTHSTVELPHLLQLDDDVRLEQIKFNDEDQDHLPEVPYIHQILLLTTL